jgi:hypothetical protein
VCTFRHSCEKLAHVHSSCTGHTEWQTRWKFYERALARVLAPNHTIHIVGERGQLNDFVAYVSKRKFASNAVFVWRGMRDVLTTSRHLWLMMTGSTYILGHSSFHLWGATLSMRDDVTVAWASGGHYKLWGVPSSWIEVEF